MASEGFESEDQVPEQDHLPETLQASVQRHRAHLAALVQSLRSAGLPEDMIDESVRQLVDSYGAELAAALRALRKDSTHA